MFELYSDLAIATSALTDGVDVAAVALTNPSQVTVTLAEYGNAVINTRKLELFSFSAVKPAIANIVAFNMLDSIDDVVLTELKGGTNVAIEISGAIDDSSPDATSMTSTDIFKAKHVRYVVAKMRTNKAVPRRDGLYACYIHPEVSHDLRADGSTAGWRQPHEYQANAQIWSGEIGTFEGAFFIETPRAYNAVDAGTGDNTVRDFRTIFCGQQALAEAVAEEFHIVLGEVTDKLKRFTPIGWYGVAGWKRYREDSLFRVETTSSIHTA